MTASDAPTYKMTGSDEGALSLIKETSTLFADAAYYLEEHGVSTEIAQQAASILSKPFLITLRDLQRKVQGDALPLVYDMVVNYIRMVAESCTISSLWRVVRSNSGNALEFTIALTENKLEHRSPLRDFRLDYEDSGLNDLVPLLFHLIPAELAGDVISSEKIELVA